jgi:hypothetical protein
MLNNPDESRRAFYTLIYLANQTIKEALEIQTQAYDSHVPPGYVLGSWEQVIKTNSHVPQSFELGAEQISAEPGSLEEILYAG